jgi:hypothetical protein
VAERICEGGRQAGVHGDDDVLGGSMRRYGLHLLGWSGALLVVFGGWRRTRPGAVQELELSAATAGWLLPMALGSILGAVTTVLMVRRWWRAHVQRPPA